MTVLAPLHQWLPARTPAQGTRSKPAYLRGVCAELPASALLRRQSTEDHTGQDRDRAARCPAHTGIPGASGEEAQQLGTNTQRPARSNQRVLPLPGIQVAVLPRPVASDPCNPDEEDR